jgi:hypothetical protein
MRTLVVALALSALVLVGGAGAAAKASSNFAITLVSLAPAPPGYSYGTVNLTVRRAKRLHQPTANRVQVMTLCGGDYHWGNTAYVGPAAVAIAGEYTTFAGTTTCEVYVYELPGLWYQPDSNVITFVPL